MNTRIVYGLQLATLPSIVFKSKSSIWYVYVRNYSRFPNIKYSTYACILTEVQIPNLQNGLKYKIRRYLNV